ncbi:PTS system fructose-specific EIIABC component [Vibrio mediterranei]|uniref:protein-N(pi)-phosphohistidine--D-fructose phosphotransferase n=1 Tax=Vibrio mediterranei TaxID=689 RepID=A0ABX5DEJ7_9VIBR|nr:MULTISPECIES: fructose-specific PTS transporter subunit EIIC [Vibrio]EDL55937.1 PTS system, mannose-specific IIAB component [Vibrio mediterranei AK1]MDA0106926.1 fructose-specific PTS transporter subunit EIIC [Vibrio sp. La 4.2.2]PCD89525.1 PTS fructose transporter subunit IIC [Vibrio mediterranei]PRQ68114.1 PTS fructose transporter subunit IIC [Vibrio mediterranei]PTC04808.1 PTS fructose transporter subunit IIC [Vibrio mediterranei]
MMKEILNAQLIKLDLAATDKDAVFNELADVLVNAGKVSDKQQFVKDVWAREETGNTGFEDGIALPHAKSASVVSPAIAVGISKQGIEYGAEDGQPSNIFFMIASPEKASNFHVEVLAKLSSKIVEPTFLENLRSATSNEEALALLVADDKASQPTVEATKGFIIGVTGCPVGVAHTYLAAEGIENAAAEMGYECKVETNGSVGVKNIPTEEEIARADAIVVACDKQVDLNRFKGKRVIITGVKKAIKDADKLIEQALAAPLYAGDGKSSASQATTSPGGSGKDLYKYLMNGVSHMIPFVVVGGILIAISLAIGGEPTPGGLAIPEGSLWNKILDVGVVGFTLMIPVLAGYIAYAIADRPGLAPGLIGGWIANNGSFYDADAGTGFIGAIIAGLLVGYFVKWIVSFNYSKMIQPLVPIMIAPIAGSLFIAAVFIFIIGAPIAGIMETMNNVLANLSTGNVIIIGLVIGLMQGFDMGGPFGKVAFLFSVGLIAEGQTQFMGAQAAAIPVAPLGMALAAFLGSRMKLFEREEVENAKAATAMGMVGISEGAIPFAARDPFAVIPANMIGSAVACVLGFTFGLTCNVAHGGPIVVLLGAFNKPVLALLAMAIGVVTTAAVAITLKKIRYNKAQKEQATQLAMS